MSPTTSRPTYAAPGKANSPTFGNPSVIVTSARRQLSSAAPVSAFRPVGRSGAPGAQEGIDDQIGPYQLPAEHGEPGIPLGVEGGHRPLLGGLVVAIARRVARPDVEHYRRPGVVEVAGGDEAIAAVVAGADQHEGALAPRLFEAERGLVGHGAAGVLHQRGRRDARGLGAMLDLAHLIDGDKLHRNPRSACVSSPRRPR